MLTSSNHSSFGPQLRQAILALEAGQVVGYPSETVWGLAAHAARPGAVQALTLRKGREEGKPIQMSCSDVQAVQAVAHWNAGLEAVAAFWPGPLTVVTAARPTCPPDLAPGGWVGVRVPDHPVIQALLAHCGGLLATTSLNPSGQPAARTVAEARAYALADLLLPDTDQAVYSGSGKTAGVASTVIQLPAEPQQAARILREGGLPFPVLAEALARVGILLVSPT
ncbi:L-threonylcarbamoyladenylate synthase [Deinococcus puniceus]|uniref:L-threonylcarbamoyladenylate synthase n=1 Tax=Deinococcus puniceus TaxID=1182568 RepID=A0A172T8X0_9DEIO|nr:L-threonylcarbamoyladenylate synthase [Deinococcus puniceus]ANE43460.1 translation factor Sua5 [Deinococcus puniceus]